MTYYTEDEYDRELITRQHNYILNIVDELERKRRQEGITRRDYEHLEQLRDYYMMNHCGYEFIYEDDYLLIDGRIYHARIYAESLIVD